ncbi:MAG TPA: alpha/beta hydrolase [Candidatus Binatia bacterium]|nr:alpha/beta hydrolase [Candidatus Binatia bacterium]
MGLSAESARLVGAVTGGLLPESVVVPGPVAVRCLVWGARTDPAALLVHGNGAHAHWWDALVPALVPGWRLVVPDLRGHGESGWPAEPAYGLEDFVEDLTAVADALAPGGVALVGHSMGGRIALAAAARLPERVRGLAILDSRLDRVRPEEAARWRGRMAGVRHGRAYPSRAAAMAAFRFVPDEPAVPDAVRADLAFHAVVERAPGEWTFRFDRAVLSPAGDGAADLLAIARAVRCPALVLAGEASEVMDAGQRARVLAALPGARAQTFPGAHHFLLAGAPAVGRTLRAFLDTLG